MHKRSQWVASEGGANARVSMRAGRTGTRLNIGQPQPRWEEGVALAKTVLGSRDTTLIGNQPLSIGSRIRNAMSTLHRFFDSHASDNDNE